ncbi:hypothetical protein PTTG_03243 [Puccinia triticina 1-1 BBBD Race 1]|uniref:Uncharacterized protein n=1 Tax=Puccinia triticina (isolate 1-1 / race 1 (BBBD)) TaxID=630390 RepID=A0A0C4ER32_PUCT1|nr:hypothetical protein PTTG_03243 [Puccinia triticina 1-1 BBBD Race 1]
MAANPNDALANLQHQMADMPAELNLLKAAPHQGHNAVLAAVQAQEHRQEIILGSFLKSPLKLYQEVNPDHVVFSFNSANYAQWEESIEATLQYHSPLMKNTIDKPLLGIIKAAGHKTTKAIFKALKLKCGQSNWRHKIDLMTNLMELVNNTGIANETMMSAWAKVMSELEQTKLTLNKAVGILLQMNFKPVTGTELTKFEFTVNQHLIKKKDPSFANVSTIIQAATGKVSKKSVDGP